MYLELPGPKIIVTRSKNTEYATAAAEGIASGEPIGIAVAVIAICILVIGLIVWLRHKGTTGDEEKCDLKSDYQGPVSAGVVERSEEGPQPIISNGFVYIPISNPANRISNPQTNSGSGLPTYEAATGIPGPSQPDSITIQPSDITSKA
ncbi:hypothetical protein ABW19_dt0206201 [Dactylella cylindrospora]|nr:hypothetical protein ABW19_dt0206201 [Dactylella cylindrospora]